MSIPDAVVERVALALVQAMIDEALPAKETVELIWGNQDDRIIAKRLASAALSASKWAEMRDALNAFLKANDEYCSLMGTDFDDPLSDAAAKARAASRIAAISENEYADPILSGCKQENAE